jgi:hypothetical protein
MRFRKWSDSTRRKTKPFYVDLRPLERISPAAALLFVSEFDRWKRLHHHRLRARDSAEWNPDVKELLRQMGFFQLLNVTDDDELPPSQVRRNTTFLQFTSGYAISGSSIRGLRELIESAIGKQLKKESRLLLFQAISEAITNVGHHAYGVKAAVNLKREPWWMSASIDYAASLVTVMVLDHGIGIPRTLPTKPLGDVRKEVFLRSLRHFFGVSSLAGFNDDARMIEAAIFLGRSRTNQRYRGHGLSRDVQYLVKEIEGSAKLRIHSNCGQYVFEKSGSGNETTTLKNRKESLGGTFVEWQFQFPQRGLDLT